MTGSCAHARKDFKLINEVVKKKKTTYKNIFPRRNNRHVMALAQTCPTTCRDHVVDPTMGSAAVEGCKLLFFFLPDSSD